MNDLNLPQKTMSSVEIAELAGKRHDHVMRDTRKMLEELELDAPKFGAIYKDKANREKPCFDLPKDLTITLVSGYEVKMRHRIVTRWQELESQQQHLIPQSLPEALRLAADLAEQNAQLKPKAAALDRIATAEGSLCVTDAAKELQVKPMALFKWLSTNEWIYKRTGNKHWVAYQRRIQQGVLEHKSKTVETPTGDERIVDQVRVTPKGLTKLAELLNQDQAA